MQPVRSGQLIILLNESDQTFDVSIACTRKGDGDFRPFHAKCLGCINTPKILRLCQSLYLPEN